MTNKYDSHLKVFGFCVLFFLFSLNVFAQVGIGTLTPKTTLDVNGAVSLREGSVISLSSGNNIDISSLQLGSSPYSQYRVTATGNFAIRMIEPISGSDGQILTLINDSDHTMTIRHDVGGNINNRIYCPGMSNLTLNGKYASVTLQYNLNLLKWIVVNYADAEYGNNITSVSGKSDTETNNANFVDMADMTLTFTPKHSTVYVTFSAAGDMAVGGANTAKNAYAIFKLVYADTGNTITGTQTLVSDYDDMSGTATAWNANISMFPVSVIPGQEITLKIQWLRDGINAKKLFCQTATYPYSSHRNLTIFD